MIRLSENKKEKLDIHRDILSQYTPPYWYVEVNRDPKYPLDQYTIPIRNRRNRNEIYKDDDVHFPCGYCKSEDTKLIMVDLAISNAGGWKGYEFRCEICGFYTYYEEKEFS